MTHTKSLFGDEFTLYHDPTFYERIEKGRASAIRMTAAMGIVHDPGPLLLHPEEVHKLPPKLDRRKAVFRHLQVLIEYEIQYNTARRRNAAEVLGWLIQRYPYVMISERFSFQEGHRLVIAFDDPFAAMDFKMRFY